MSGDFERFKAVYDAVERRIEARYGVAVAIADALDPNTGDFDGLAISVDHDQNVDMAVLVLLHLLGHAVQRNVSPELLRPGLAAVKVPVDEALLPAIRDYERRASAYGLSPLHECGVRDLDGWLSDWTDADWRFLDRPYRTGEKLEFRDLLVPDRPRLSPLPSPPFTPRRWVSRYSF